MKKRQVKGLYAGINAVRRFAVGRAIYSWPKRCVYWRIGGRFGHKRNDGTIPSIDFSCGISSLLRHDNADLRLTEKGRELGLIDDERYADFQAKQEAIEAEIKRMQSIRLKANSFSYEAFLAEKGIRGIGKTASF